jgi:diketogulonate reductase-like aldo/keto reductase
LHIKESESFPILRPIAPLNNGAKMPMLGLGLYQVPPGKFAEQTVKCALETGYRLIDTARYYENEGDVGRAISRSGVQRKEIFVTTKLWNDDHGFHAALRAFDRSIAELGLEYVDLYLIHWPVKNFGVLGWGPVAKGLDRVGLKLQTLRLKTWNAMEHILASGRCRAIGVSNYTVAHLKQLLSVCRVVPAVNQVEFTPFCFQRELLEYCVNQGIQLQAYSPLARGQRLHHPTLITLARKHGRSVTQVLLRWALQHGVAVIPKASQPEHIRQNCEIFDFVLPAEDMTLLDGLNENLHLCWDPTNAP